MTAVHPSRLHREAAGLQVFTACLGLLGPVLHDLRMRLCWGNLFTSESLRLLWTCPRLCNLTLYGLSCDVLAADVEAGLQHLRCAALIPFKLYPSNPLVLRQRSVHWSSVLLSYSMPECQAAGVFAHKQVQSYQRPRQGQQQDADASLVQAFKAAHTPAERSEFHWESIIAVTAQPAALPAIVRVPTGLGLPCSAAAFR